MNKNTKKENMNIPKLFESYKNSLMLESNVVKEISNGNFYKPFFKFFISGIILLYINILILPQLINIFDATLTEYTSLFVGLNSIPLLIGTGSSIFMGSNFEKFKNSNTNLKRIVNIILVGSIILSLVLSILLFVSGIIPNTSAVISVFAIISLQNTFTSLNLLLRTSGKVLVTNIFAIIQYISIIIVSHSITSNFSISLFSIMTLYIVLILVLLWYFSIISKNIQKTENNLSRNEENEENKKVKTINTNTQLIVKKTMIKRILFLGTPTFLVQIFSLIAYIMIINFKNIVPFDISSEDLAIRTIISTIDKINIIIIALIQASGIIFTYNFYDSSSSKNNTIKTINSALIVNVVISLILMFFGMNEISKTRTNLLSPEQMAVFNTITTTFILGYPLLTTSLVIGGLFSSISKIYTSIIYNILKLYILFIPITFVAIWYNLTQLKLYSNIVSYIILLIFIVLGYSKLRKEIINVKFKQNNS